MQTVSELSPNKEAKPWPDGLPTVSVDIDMGKRYSSVIVDPDELTSLLDRLDMPVDQRADHSFVVVDPDVVTEEHHLGYFYPSSKTVVLWPHERINQSLTHEFTHAKDNIDGNIESLESIRKRKIIERAKYAGGIALASVLPNIALAIHSGLDTPMGKINAASALFGGIGTKAMDSYAKHREYRTRPSESRAFANEENPLFEHDAITLVKKELL